jgi:hypothetical protein
MLTMLQLVACDLQVPTDSFIFLRKQWMLLKDTQQNAIDFFDKIIQFRYQLRINKRLLPTT